MILLKNKPKQLNFGKELGFAQSLCYDCYLFRVAVHKITDTLLQCNHRVGGFSMAQLQVVARTWHDRVRINETDALRIENAELRETAAELLLQTTILREALRFEERRTSRAS